ncbi:MAG: carboxypeptidase regulatory-like domain-containing protein [Saprospiraceae bacterium]|nr:carboxypeptidase regulatory-like domain-containing protein [Saprospiraceae bacterium]
MKLRYTLLLLFFSILSFAQSYTVSGKIVDENDDNVIGANVSLKTATDSLFRAAATNQYGNFTLENVPQGSYQLKVSYIGFKTYYQQVFVRGNLDFGFVTINTDKVALEEVEVVEQVLTVVQKEDTTEINADAFKTNPDATAEDLLKKMPGVTSTNGKISAQGEEVKEVLVDGRPFFGNDPNAALKTLPAEVVAKIQIYDKESEQSQLTGVSDGQTTKTINIITKSNMRAGEFGKIYTGYGYDNKYAAGGNINFFKNARRISIIAQTNNVNQQNFSNDDLLSVMGSSGRGRRGGGRGGDENSGDFLVNAQNGISTTHAFGVNYSDKWGEKLDVSGSYFLICQTIIPDKIWNELI